MSFDPTQPADHSALASQVMRDQLNGSPPKAPASTRPVLRRLGGQGLKARVNGPGAGVALGLTPREAEVLPRPGS